MQVPPFSLTEQLAQLGPELDAAVLEVLRSGQYIGGGVIALCMVLAGFDHRRSGDRGGVLLISGVLGAMGALAWVEIAGRVGLFAWMGTGAGFASILTMAVAWSLGRRTLRRA